MTQLFPDGHVINLHPWEYNEVPVLLGAALQQNAPIVALHLTRPPIAIPDREALGMPSHFEAARGAYVVRDYTPGQPKGGTLSSCRAPAHGQHRQDPAGAGAARPERQDRLRHQPELFALQPEELPQQVLPADDRVDSTVITTQARVLMHDWLFTPVSEEYALSADWDNRWRTGGTLDEVIDEAHLSPEWVLEGIERFVVDRPKRLEAVRSALGEVAA